MDIFLFSTTDHKSDRREVLTRMLDSVSAAAKALPEHRLHLHILYQRCTEAELAPIKALLPDFVQAQSIETQVSLSKARNLLLEPALSSGRIEADSLVAFPDDDGWYPDGLITALTEHLIEDTQLGFAFCRYGSQPSTWQSAKPPIIEARARDVVRNASSNTLFVRGSVANAVGLFDEGLGLGTPNHGAEDLDYALRAYLAAPRSLYFDATLVGHRDKNREIRAKYYRGGLITLARYASASTGVALEYLRKLGVGSYLCLKRELSLTAYASAIFAGSRSR